MVVEEVWPLLEKIGIGGAQIRNRFVRSATHEWLACDDGRPTEPIARIHETLSKNGIGLCISGYAFISMDGRGSKGQQGIHSDDVLPYYREIVDRVHKHGSAFFIQLVHNGRHSFATRDCPNPPSASELPIPGTSLNSRSMTEKEIEKVINDFVSAIGRSKKAGADGIQLHCAHGFLLSSFLSPFLNRREDDWGGDTTRRTRIVVEILRRAKKRFPEYPMAAKMNCTDGVEGGIDMDEAVRIAKILASEGIDAIEVSGGIEDAPNDITCQRVDSPEQEAYFREYSKAIRQKVDCPVILVGGIRSLRVMNRMVSNGYADMVSMSRPLIREPDLISKIVNGRKTEASCVSCNKCFDTTGVKCNRMSIKYD